MAIRSHEISTYKGAAESLPDTYFLGQVLYFTISQMAIPITQAHQELSDLGLPVELLKTRVRPIDAFRKATKELEKKFPTTDDGIRSVFMVRSAGQDEDASHRFVVLERLRIEKGKKRRLAYEVVAECRFRRGTINKEGQYIGHSIEVVPKQVPGFEFTDGEAEWIEYGLKILPDRFRHWIHNLDDGAIRAYVRDYVRTLGGTCLKESGSFYFVRQRHAQKVALLKQWLRSLGQEFNSFPLLDLTEQRDLLRQAVAEETKTEIERLQAEIAPVIKGERKILPTTVEAFLDRSAELLERTKEYEQILEDDLEDTRDLLNVFRRQVMELARQD